MDADRREGVIVFDNLVRPTSVVGEFAELQAVQPPAEPFAHPNAAGAIRAVKSFEDIKTWAAKSGARLKGILTA